MIDRIVGLIFLPLGAFLFLNIFGITTIPTIFGISVLLIAAIGLIIVQIANIMSAHFDKEDITKTYIICGILVFPSLVYFYSLFAVLSAPLAAALPAMLASFLFVEGIYSFYF